MRIIQVVYTTGLGWCYSAELGNGPHSIRLSEPHLDRLSTLLIVVRTPPYHRLLSFDKIFVASLRFEMKSWLYGNLYQVCTYSSYRWLASFQARENAIEPIVKYLSSLKCLCHLQHLRKEKIGWTQTGRRIERKENIWSLRRNWLSRSVQTDFSIGHWSWRKTGVTPI